MNPRLAQTTFAILSNYRLRRGDLHQAVNRKLLTLLLAGLSAGLCMSLAVEKKRLRPLPELDQNVQTGPEVGAPIPKFEIPDQNGKLRTFDDLRGPGGLLLLFHRSADW